MASNSFKIKNSLVLTPKDLSTLTSPEAGDLACDINDSNKIKRYDANAAAWVEVGSGGVGGVDILFVQDFESASLSSFTEFGLLLSQTDPLRGKVSAKLTHQTSINQFFKQVIPVDTKFRGESMTLSLDCRSTASQGNLVIKITDETNLVELVASEQLQLSSDISGAKSSVTFTIPSTCESISYTIIALPQAGGVTSRIDDIICQLAETALLETAVTVPNVTAWQGYTPTFQGFGTPTNVEFEWRQVGENVEIRGKFVSGTPSSVEARVGLPAGLTSAGTGVIPSIQIAGIAGRTGNSAAPYSTLIEPNVTYMAFGLASATTGGILNKRIGSDVILASESFSIQASVPCAGLSATTTKTIPLTQSGLVQDVDSAFRIDGALGYGSTGTTTLRFNTANIRESRGSDISYVSSSVNGDSFVVTSSGVYSISADAVLTNGSTALGITKNSSSTSTAITTIATNNPQQVLTLSTDVDTNYNNVENVSWSGYLEAGDIIRVQTSGVAIGSAALFRFSMSKQGSLKQVSVSSDQKITIPTSELRMEGASSRGSTATAIVRFDSVAKLRGDAFTVESDAVLGTRITMKKAGKLDVSSSLFIASGAGALITRNQSNLTLSLTNPASEILTAQGTSAAANRNNISWSGFVNVGDIIRVAAEAVPSAANHNQLNLSFQEQEIAVSVSNTLPQFSESDSYVRAVTGNGFGSSATTVRRFASVTSNIGADILYADSATAGASFTAKSAGVYNISYTDASVSSTPSLQILINGILISQATIPVATGSITATAQPYLNVGDVIQLIATPAANISSASSIAQVLISKVGKPNVTGVNVTPFVNVPQQETQAIEQIAATTTFVSNIARFTSLSKNTNNGILRYSDDATVGTRFTALKKCSMLISVEFAANAANSGLIRRNGSTVVTAYINSTNHNMIASANLQLEVGDYIDITRTGAGVTSAQGLTILAEAASDSIVSPTESFSTDTAQLTYASSSLYNLTTLANAPVGTYITFTYAANTNTRTQTTTRPTQTDADMNVNGIQLFARAFNQTSSAASPACIAIQIGKGMKGVSLGLYKSAGKVTSGELDSMFDAATQRNGMQIKSYNESTGILIIDAGYNSATSITNAYLAFSDITTQNNGYLVINASKSPALTGVPQLLPRIATLSDVKASGTAGGTATSGSYQTRTLNTLSDPSGIVTSLASNQFTLPAGEYYIEASAFGYNCELHKLRIQNISDSTTSLLGEVAYSRVASVAGVSALLKGSITISSAKTFELQHRVGSSATGNGFGLASSFGDNEVYAVVKITKVK